MPSRLDTPVLTIDLVSEVDIQNVKNLFNMWTVFSRCVGSLDESRRLANLSWRVWNLQTFCERARVTPPAIALQNSENPYTIDILNLSRSEEGSSTSTPAKGQRRASRITRGAFKDMVQTIKGQTLEPLNLPHHSYFALTAEASTSKTTPTAIAASGEVPPDSAATSKKVHSESTSGVSGNSTKVVRGFSLSHRSTPLPPSSSITMSNHDEATRTNYQNKNNADHQTDESAISDDDNTSVLEDDESRKSDFDNRKLFRRRKWQNIAFLPSLITTILQNDDNTASKLTPASQQSVRSPPDTFSTSSSNFFGNASLIMKKSLKPDQEVPQPGAEPIIIVTRFIHPQAALSPKTTRRNMLQTELTASLRRHLLWERQQKNQTAAAVFKRRHTAPDFENPERTSRSWKQYFPQDFNSRGW